MFDLCLILKREQAVNEVMDVFIQLVLGSRAI